MPGTKAPINRLSGSFFQREEESPLYLTDYEGYDSRQMSKMAHIEAMGDGTWCCLTTGTGTADVQCKGGQDQVMVLAML